MFYTNMGAGVFRPMMSPADVTGSRLETGADTRLEHFLAAIAGEPLDIEPKERIEFFLAEIAGYPNSLEPKSRIEHFLAKIAKSRMGSKRK